MAYGGKELLKFYSAEGEEARICSVCLAGYPVIIPCDVGHGSRTPGLFIAFCGAMITFRASVFA